MIARYLRWLRGKGYGTSGDHFILLLMNHALKTERQLVIDYTSCPVDQDEVF